MALAPLKNLFISSSKERPWAFLIALMIILACHLAELFILPLNAFTFRSWEALRTGHHYSFALGPFYPNEILKMTEEGDLGHHTAYAVEKQVVWQTDSFGFRNQNILKKYDIVVMGDSNIAGSGLSQEETLGEILAKKTGMAVYSFSPANPQTFLQEQRFIDNPPKIIIHGVIEKFIPELASLKKDNGQPAAWRQKIWQLFLQKHQTLACWLDRLNKRVLFFALRAQAKRSLNNLLAYSLPGLIKNKTESKLLVCPELNMLFDEGIAFQQEINEATFEEAVRAIKSYQQTMAQKGIRYIFLPIPNKENIYHQCLNNPKPDFLKKFTAKLKENNIEFIETETAFEKAAEAGKLLFQLDDTHWNVQAVNLAVELIVKELISSKNVHEIKK